MSSVRDSLDLGGARVSVKYHNGRFGLKLSLISGIVLIVLLVLVGFELRSTHNLEGLVGRIAAKEEILSRMRINLLKSVEIEKGAVMADTDELSRKLAEESLEKADAVEQDRQELNRLVEADHTDREQNLLREFNRCWSELQKIDRILLTFAVENTNIKASTLSFTEGGKNMERFERSLIELIRNTPNSDHGNDILKSCCDALSAGFKALYLHAPHIAASNDAQMDEIEKGIHASDMVVKESLAKLDGIVSGDGKKLVEEAAAAYADFEKVTAEVIKLSRQNTNIKSFELSLGRKRKVTTQCDEMLAALQEAVHSRNFEATR